MQRSAAILVLVMCTALWGCASSELKILSTPEGSEITARLPNQPPVRLGQTPYTLKQKERPELFSSALHVTVKKDGYSPQAILVPLASVLGSQGQLNFSLEDSPLPKACQAKDSDFNDFARGVADVANLLQRKRYDEANTIVQGLLLRFSTVSVLYDLQGNIFYLQKDLKKALVSYTRSIELSPNNSQTQAMIERIRQLQGQGS